MERKGKWWREYTKQHLEGGRNPEPEPEPEDGPEPDAAPEPIVTPSAKVFEITLQAPRPPAQPQKQSPYQRLKAWLLRHIGKIFFALTIALIGRILRKQSGRR